MISLWTRMRAAAVVTALGICFLHVLGVGLLGPDVRLPD